MFEIRTPATTERAAFDQLRRFEAGPEGAAQLTKSKAVPRLTCS